MNSVVIDTNILVSALISPFGGAYTFVYTHVFSGEYVVYVTNSIMAEYEEVLRRPIFGFDLEDVLFVLKWFRENAVFIEVNVDDYLTEDVPDKTDVVFFVAARATGSKLVTGNIKHYPVTEFRTMLWEVL